jgi:hypothetical protein
MENPTLFIKRGRLRRGASCPPFASPGGLQIARPGGRPVAEMPAALCTTPLAALAARAARAARTALTALAGRAREPLPLAQQAGCEQKSLFGGVVGARSSRPRLLIGPVGVACSALCKLRSSLIVRPASARGRAKRCNPRCWPLRPCYSPSCVGCLPGLPWDSAGPLASTLFHPTAEAFAGTA